MSLKYSFFFSLWKGKDEVYFIRHSSWSEDYRDCHMLTGWLNENKPLFIFTLAMIVLMSGRAACELYEIRGYPSSQEKDKESTDWINNFYKRPKSTKVHIQMTKTPAAILIMTGPEERYRVTSLCDRELVGGWIYSYIALSWPQSTSFYRNHAWSLRNPAQAVFVSWNNQNQREHFPCIALESNENKLFFLN